MDVKDTYTQVFLQAANIDPTPAKIKEYKNESFMKKSTLIYSVILGLGSVFAVYSVVSDVNQSNFEARVENNQDSKKG